MSPSYLKNVICCNSKQSHWKFWAKGFYQKKDFLAVWCIWQHFVKNHSGPDPTKHLSEYLTLSTWAFPAFPWDYIFRQKRVEVFCWIRSLQHLPLPLSDLTLLVTQSDKSLLSNAESGPSSFVIFPPCALNWLSLNGRTLSDIRRLNWSLWWKSLVNICRGL